MVGYIGTQGVQAAGAAMVMPAAQELTAAERVLAQSPVSGHRGFTSDEVRALAGYRCRFGAGTNDAVWQAIVSGRPEAWMYAVHEAAEIEAFVLAGVNFMNTAAFRAGLSNAHLQACVAEDSFLRAWAIELGYTSSEMALERNNPIRTQHGREHLRLLSRLELELGWAMPSLSEDQEAIAFYRRILP